MKANKQVRRATKRLFRLCLANGQLDEARARRLVAQIAQSDRRDRVPMLSQLRRLVLLYLSRRSARVDSARSVDPQTRQILEAQLQRMYGPGLEAAFAEDPSLIAGMRVKVGSDVYDGSLRAALDALAARI